MALSQNPGLSDSRLAFFCCLPVSCPRLSLSIRFPRQPLLHLSYPHIYRKGFWGSFWSRSFTNIQKSEGSKTLLYAYLSVGEGTKFPPLLNMPKNSLLTTPVFQGGEGPSFFYSCKFPSSSDSSAGTKTSLPTRGTIQDFYQLICPWYQSQFEHYLVYNLGIKLWIQKGKMISWHKVAMTFFRLQRKLVKMKFFSWKLQNQFFLQM